jgi:hypothetical protein
VESAVRPILLGVTAGPRRYEVSYHQVEFTPALGATRTLVFFISGWLLWLL